MGKKDFKDTSPKEDAIDTIGEEEYNDLELLERLESLREDMEELGITTVAKFVYYPMQG